MRSEKNARKGDRERCMGMRHGASRSREDGSSSTDADVRVFA